ncbi:MAG: TolC family outer membrane protein [Sphingomonadaceae bacterium]
MLLLSGCAIIAAPAQADTLREALTEAYASNPVLQAARARQRATDENVVIEKSAGLPSASASAQEVEFLLQNDTTGTVFGPDRQIGAGVDLSVPIYSGGSVKNSVRAAKTRVKAGQADLRATESSVFSQVVAAYMDVIRSEAIVGLSANQVRVLEVNLQATSDRFEIGDLTRTDVAQSESRLALSRSDLRSAQANLVAARENYIALVGSAPNQLQPPPPLPGLPDSISEAQAIALEYNPDLLAAKEQAKAAEYDIDVAGAGRLPRISLFAGGDYSNYLDSLTALDGSKLPQTSTTAQAGVQLSIPLFQGGRPAAMERQAQARAAAALENEIGAERNVIAQVRSSWSSWKAAHSIVESSQQAVSAAELSLEGVRAENTVGNRTILDILNAEQELLQSKVQLVTARRNAYVAGFSLLAAMGRAEARDLGLGDEEGLLYDPTLNYTRVQAIWFDWERDPDPQAQSTRTVDIPAPDATIPPQ